MTFQDRVYDMFRNQKMDTKTIAEKIYHGDEAGVERALHYAIDERVRIMQSRAERLDAAEPSA